jgi:methylated-DNA-[protein]-cysteine S-methyltransferase
MKSPLVELPVATREGIFLAHYSTKGLAELDFPHRDGLVAPNQNKSMGRTVGRSQEPRAVAERQIPTQILRWHRLTTDALKKVLAGIKPKEFPPLDWAGKTEFQKSVWKAMRKLSPDKTKSYGEIAQAIGNPRAVRAVGSACGANPIPVLVPCHRILAANNKIGGFGSGLDWKYKLLAAEGIHFQSSQKNSPANRRFARSPLGLTYL